MKIGWAAMTVGIFGSVREMVEMANAQVRRGHTVTIYHPDGGPVTWLPALARMGRLEEAETDDLDVLIVFPEFTVGRLFDVLEASRARVKAVVMAGGTPTPELASMLRGETPLDEAPEDLQRLVRAARRFWMLPDSDWQSEWFRTEAGIDAGPGWAGVNLDQFHPVKGPKTAGKPVVMWSGDPRPRKGGEMVRTALDLVKMARPEVAVESYWNRRIAQKDLAAFICRGDVFVDGHTRAGWCNPVVEAMACGVAVVCTDIPATREVAVHERTALVVPVGDPQSMALAVLRLLADGELKQALIHRAFKRVQSFSYDERAEGLLRAIEERLDAGTHSHPEDGGLDLSDAPAA